MNVTEVAIAAPPRARDALASFYLGALDLEGSASVEAIAAIRVGGSRLVFTRADKGIEPFYHFALLVPGNRFVSALEWLRARTPLLSDPATGEDVFDFENWDALACYCLDPVGNIVELIAHRGLEESARKGRFSPGELVGFSEVGLVCKDKKRVADALAQKLGLVVWDGDIEDARRLAFVGGRGRTLILCPEGRGWLPTGRRAEIHPMHLVLRGTRGVEVALPGAPHRVTVRT